jgi:DNA recombination protein Rad52
MPFSQTQLDALNAPLSRDAVKTRKQGGREVSYVEGWYVEAEANRIFGFDGWSSETLDMRCVSERGRPIGEAQKPGWGVTYAAKVRIVAGGIIREGSGIGHGIDLDLGQAHESAIKEAETDARKRALKTFGNPLGLALYDKQQANVADEADLSRLRFIEECRAKIEAFNDPDPKVLLNWWNSDAQRIARRDFAITAAELLLLKNLVTAKIPARTSA